MGTKIAKIGRKLGERVYVEGPCETWAERDPNHKNRVIVYVLTEEGVQVSRGKEQNEPNSELKCP